MNFKNLILISMLALVFGACSDDDDGDSMQSQADLLVANDWVYQDIFVDGVPIGFTSCGGDDFLSLTAAAEVSFNTALEPDTCTLTLTEFAGTYELRSDSLIITAVDADGDNADANLEITLLSGSELRLQGEDPIFGTTESRYIAQ